MTALLLDKFVLCPFTLMKLRKAFMRTALAVVRIKAAAVPKSNSKSGTEEWSFMQSI
jgi:hypothetical protein